jgi:hypothetical protein
MTRQSLNQIGQNRRERLVFIDFRLYFLGTVRRSQLCERFGLAPAAATRDFSLYRKLAPDNLRLDGVTKHYCPAKDVAPRFDHPRDSILTILSLGYIDRIEYGCRPMFSRDIPLSINHPDIPVLAAVRRAINLGQALAVTYHSTSSGLANREIVLFALIDSGLRWHARAFDRFKNEFRDFVLPRISQPGVSIRSPDVHEQTTADIQWSQIVDLEFVPHPSYPQPEIVEQGFPMAGGVLRPQVRAAVAGYVLRRLSVDCSPCHDLSCADHALMLRNPASLYGVSSAVLAPGFIPHAEGSK